MRLTAILSCCILLFCFSKCEKSKSSTSTPPPEVPGAFVPEKNLTDDQLLELVQKQTFTYFWDFGHPISGLARERSNTNFGYGNEVVTTGGSGFGIMSIVVGAERQWITRSDAVARLNKIVGFLSKADRFHGAFPHWLNGETGKVKPFGDNDNGADIVETSYLFQGLLTAKEYFNTNDASEKSLVVGIDSLWKAVEWNWFTRGGQKVMYWHWSPDKAWIMNHQIHGWNECLITYVLAASSSDHGIDSSVYTQGFATGPDYLNGKTYYGHSLALGPDYGGPLFFSQYSFLGLDPHGLKDRFADYWQQNLNHTLINRQYCITNPLKFKGYGEKCWGLTASDNQDGYNAHSPTNDLGVITPTAALSAFPYTPEFSMKALRHFYEDLGGTIWKEYGFVDAFNETKGWTAASYLAIDQGPIIVMIENYRSGLLWKLFMRNREIQKGLRTLGFESPYLK